MYGYTHAHTHTSTHTHANIRTHTHGAIAPTLICTSFFCRGEPPPHTSTHARTTYHKPAYPRSPCALPLAPFLGKSANRFGIHSVGAGAAHRHKTGCLVGVPSFLCTCLPALLPCALCPKHRLSTTASPIFSTSLAFSDRQVHGWVAGFVLSSGVNCVDCFGRPRWPASKLHCLTAQNTPLRSPTPLPFPPTPYPPHTHNKASSPAGTRWWRSLTASAFRRSPFCFLVW
jgi:hypothetical protein